ncbi:MAG TPA: acyl-CoA thioesterase [Flavisolibacter sp.]|nr:acyl-CoA thioesterase [Flavisolibacter sp.]
MKNYEFRHSVSFGETNLVGNVYFTNFLVWQGACREMFLYENCPEIVREIQGGTLALVTIHCSCDYLGELRAFDQILILMELLAVSANRVRMRFEYFKLGGQSKILVAKGAHEIGCFKRTGQSLSAIPIPECLLQALEEYKITT